MTVAVSHVAAARGAAVAGRPRAAGPIAYLLIASLVVSLAD